MPSKRTKQTTAERNARLAELEAFTDQLQGILHGEPKPLNLTILAGMAMSNVVGRQLAYETIEHLHIALRDARGARRIAYYESNVRERLALKLQGREHMLADLDRQFKALLSPAAEGIV